MDPEDLLLVVDHVIDGEILSAEIDTGLCISISISLSSVLFHLSGVSSGGFNFCTKSYLTS